MPRSLGRAIQTNNPNEVKYDCPFCPTVLGKVDDKAHMYVNFTKGTYICFRCESTGSTYKLREFMNVDANKFVATPSLSTLRDKIGGLFNLKKAPPLHLDLMSWSIFAPEAPMAYKYMKDRGFTDEEMQRWDLKVGRAYEDPKTKRRIVNWSGRVIFPFHEDGEVVYMVGRSYVGREPKYYNPPGGGKFVFNIDSVRGECILCEGIISAIAAERVTGIPSVAALGKTLTNFQLAKIAARCTKIYVCLDGTDDVTKRIRDDLNRQLVKVGLEVWEVRPPVGKDPDDAGAEMPDCLSRAVKKGII